MRLHFRIVSPASATNVLLFLHVGTTVLMFWQHCAGTERNSMRTFRIQGYIHALVYCISCVHHLSIIESVFIITYGVLNVNDFAFVTHFDGEPFSKVATISTITTIHHDN